MKQPASTEAIQAILNQNHLDLTTYDDLRKHIHSHPELSTQEVGTAEIIGRHLRSLDTYAIHTNIGGYGIAAVLRNGPGKTVLLRADMDALPIREETGLPYASKVTQKDDVDGLTKPVMHACGHDVHVVCLLAAAEKLSKSQSSWSGTLILVFQPAEERGSGAQAMVDDGLYEKVPIPDVVLAQHVFPNRAGYVGIRPGLFLVAADSFKITFFGKGGHGSAPENTVDPILMASSVVVRLQTIVSREISPSAEFAIITVGTFHAGEAENIIPDRAEIRINVRTADAPTREKVLAAMRRIVKAESEASNAPKEALVERISGFPPTHNDEALTNALSIAFRDYFKGDFDPDMARNNASEDFTVLGTSIGKPCAFWVFGGTDQDLYDDAKRRGLLKEKVPGNHTPFYAPAMQPTLEVGVDALCLAALTFLSVRDQKLEAVGSQS